MGLAQERRMVDLPVLAGPPAEVVPEQRMILRAIVILEEG